MTPASVDHDVHDHITLDVVEGEEGAACAVR